MNDVKNNSVFPLGGPAPAQFAPYFTGKSYLYMLTGFDSDVPIANVTFEPGCRNNWHSHPGGQVLLVTAGRGWYVEEGKPARELRAGDVVEIPRNVRHWHGAAKDGVFSHLAVDTDKKAGETEWFEPVGEEYGLLP